MLFVIMCAVGLYASAAPIDAGKQAKIDSLELHLQEINTAKDSIRTLYNIFDLAATKAMRSETLHRLYAVAKRNGRNRVMIDVLVHGANNNRSNDSILAVIEQKLDGFVADPIQKEAKLFVRMLRIDNKVNIDDADEQNRHMRELVRSYASTPPENTYEHAEMLYSLCTYLSKASRGELLEEYIGKLESLVESMNLPSGSVRNLIYTRAAPVFTQNGHAERAVEIDKKMINIVDSLTTSYAAQGRPYRQMHTNRYTIYRRLLGNYKALTSDEIELFHNNINALAKEDARVAADLATFERAEIFYKLATGQYGPAVAAIKRQINVPSQQDYREYYLNALVEAAGHTGDKNTQLAAALEINEKLRDAIARRAEERYKELQIVYDMNELEQQNNDLKLSRQQAHLNTTRIVSAVVVIALILLFVILWVVQHKYGRMRRLANEQFAIAKELRGEREEWRKKEQELINSRDRAVAGDKLKTEFIHTMSHEVKAPLEAITEYTRLIIDCIPEDQENYLGRFAFVVNRNIKLLQTLVNDVLEMASLEHGDMNIHREPTSIDNICTLALDNIFEGMKSIKPDITVEYLAADRPDRNINTDGQRVCQVLMNLLSNANKFTESGTVSLDYTIDTEAKTATFIIQDTGIGIPDGYEEEIFERFRKLNPKTQGCGLGLYIARMVATLLGGKVKVDTSYHKGARFLFTIPIGI